MCLRKRAILGREREKGFELLYTPSVLAASQSIAPRPIYGLLLPSVFLLLPFKDAAAFSPSPLVVFHKV